jgi:hypothetical protein
MWDPMLLTRLRELGKREGKVMDNVARKLPLIAENR